MAKTENINIRIEPELKKEAEETLDYLGLTMAEAIKLFLKQVKTHKFHIKYLFFLFKSFHIN